MANFTLDPRIASDSMPVCDLGLSSVRLMRDANYPWVLLVPRRDNLAEIIDLSPEERTELMDEIGRVSEALRQAVPCDKLNVAALGNRIRQLHIHVIARTSGDAAWPNPVWGAASPREYSVGEADSLRTAIAARLV